MLRTCPECGGPTVYEEGSCSYCGGLASAWAVDHHRDLIEREEEQVTSTSGGEGAGMACP